MSPLPFTLTAPHRRLLLTLAVASAALLVGAAQPAWADSLAYIKGGDVWLSTGDGSRQFQVTSTGDYSDISQADDGTMIALAGVRLRKLDRYGAVLADFTTPVSDTSPPATRTFWGPFDPQISPDGTKVAYSWFYTTQSQTDTCYPPQCVTTLNEAGTGYSRSDRATDWSEPGFAEHTGWRNPTWVDNDTTVLSDPSHLPNSDVVVDQPATRPGSTGFMVNNWFSDTTGGNAHVSGGDISRDKTKAAFVTGQNDTTLTLYRIPSFPTSFPSGDAPPSTIPIVCYRYGNPIGGSFGTPSFSPDGRKLAFAVGDGIHVVDVPDFASGCTTAGASPTSQLLIPGATQPDWGPAEVPAARPTPSPAPTSSPTPTPTRPCTTACPRTSTLKLSVARTTLRRALRHGLIVRITGGRVGTRVRVVARGRGRVLATGSARLRSSGAGTARLVLDRRAARQLGFRQQLTLTITAPGASTKVTLRR
jgi:hypothetical protein